jgi:tRNA-2-methylthio-N6-dimethylallyladenosine synthase
MPRQFHILTVGCQMNVLDSELVAADLIAAGYEKVESPRLADVVLLNTCSVREHAEEKIYSALGRLKQLKRDCPDFRANENGTVPLNARKGPCNRPVIAVLGCMAQKDRQTIFRRAPHVDLVLGPGQLGQLRMLLDQIFAGGGQRMEVSLDRTEGDRAAVQRSFVPFVPERPAKTRPMPHQAMVRIMFGCDMFCTYCVVPRVRGPEQSRPAAEIVEEVRRLVGDGCLEATLLGQTVNSYEDRTGPSTVVLADLLYRLHDIEGLRRIKFVTNHPKFMTDELLQAMRDLPKVSPYLHVPAQSGSNEVLQRMKRGYTVELYREMLERIRRFVPQAAVTSDFIVGFCGETEEDFQQTASLVRDARFKNSFIFKYSSRPGTKAAELYADDIPENVKRRRNNDLLAIQNAISLEDSQPFLGRTVEILVEGPSKVGRKKSDCPDFRARDCPDFRVSENGTVPFSAIKKNADSGIRQLVGRTVCDRIVVFDGPSELIGRLLDVKIEKVDAFTMFGKAMAK